MSMLTRLQCLRDGVPLDKCTRICGEYVSGGMPVKVTDPYTGRRIGSVPRQRRAGRSRLAAGSGLPQSAHTLRAHPGAATYSLPR